MFKKLSLVLALAIFGLGIVFFSLDILDIAEGYRLNLPTALLNTIFISAVAVPIVYLAAGEYLTSGSPDMLGLGCGVFAFGFSILIYEWLASAGLNARMTAYDSGVLLASISYAVGTTHGMSGRVSSKSAARLKSMILLLSCVGIAGIVAITTWLAFKGAINATQSVTDGIVLRDVIQAVAGILCLGSAFLNLRKYQKQCADKYYWYFLGLLLFAFGFLIISRGPLEGRIAWLGRASQYISNLYLLVAAIYFRRRGSDSAAEVHD